MNRIKTEQTVRKMFQPDKKTVLMCIGSVLCGDDAAGMVIADKLAGSGIDVFACSTAPENFTGAVRELKPETVILIDAAGMGMKPGEVGFPDPEDIGGISFSTHMLPLKFMVDYFRALLKCSVYIIGIEPSDCSMGAEMSAEVEKTADELSGIIRAAAL